MTQINPVGVFCVVSHFLSISLTVKDSGSESRTAAAAAAKKRNAVFLDTVLAALGCRFMAATARPSCSSFMLKTELYNPNNQAYVAIRDMESAKGALDSMLVKLRAAGVSVSLVEMRDAFVARLPDEVKTGMILHGFAWHASRAATDVHLATYEEALMIETALRAAGAFTPHETKVAGPPKTTTRGEASEAVGLR